MKKFLSIFICILLLIMPLCITAFAADEVVITAPSTALAATKSNEIVLSLDKNYSLTADTIEISFNRQLELLSGDFMGLPEGEKVVLPEDYAASLTLAAPSEIKGDFFKLSVTYGKVASSLSLRVTVTFKEGGNLVLKKTVEAEFSAVCSEHKFGEWQIITPSLCESKGSKKRICAICDFEEKVETEPLGHDFSNIEILREATCLEEGYQRAFCKTCEQKLLEKIEPSGHKMSEWKIVAPPTCEAKGTEQSVCSVCSLTETRQTEPLGHEFKEAVITTEPTIGKEGIQTGECIRCSETTDSPVPCAYTDKITGIRMDTKKGVYPETAKTKIADIKDGTSLHSGVASALAHITNQFIAYNIEVTNLGFAVAPDGEVTVTFPIPEKFNKNSVFYYITEENTVKKLTVKKSEDGKTATLKFMGNGRYAICKTAYAAGDEFIAAASANSALIITLSAIALVLCWSIVALRIIKAKNPRLYKKITRSVPTKSEIKNAIKRYIFIIKETKKKP